MAKKFTDYIKEAYRLDENNDIAEELAKYTLGLFFDNENGQKTLQESFDQMFEENIKGDPYEYSHKTMVLSTLKEYIIDLKNQIDNLNLIVELDDNDGQYD